jgi:hypothetical protein
MPAWIFRGGDCCSMASRARVAEGLTNLSAELPTLYGRTADVPGATPWCTMSSSSASTLPPWR